MDESLTISDWVKELMKVVESRMGVAIDVRVAEAASGKLRTDQSEQIRGKDNHILITINDRTNVDFNLSHELYHLLLDTSGFPRLRYELTSGDKSVDEVIQAIGQALYFSVLHFVINSEQRSNGLFNSELENQYLEGFYEETPVETEESDNLVLFRVLNLLDCLVFFKESRMDIDDELAGNYPKSYAIAKRLMDQIDTHPINSPFTVRRATLILFKSFDDEMGRLGMNNGFLPELASLSPVLSDRQLRLGLNQNFELVHTEHKSIHPGKGEVYVLQGKNDGQNTFVLKLPAKTDPAFFQQLYQMPTKSFFDQYNGYYTIRE